MKLVSWVLVMLFAALAGCSRGAGAGPSSAVTSTTELKSAELAVPPRAADADTPRVGKAQRSLAPTDQSVSGEEKTPRRDDGRRSGSFSGYK